MAKENLLLRSVSNPPLTTKGSALTLAEMDANWIEVYNALKELSQSSWIDAYDNAVNYYLNDYVMYDSQLWKCVDAGAVLNVTPGTDATKWQEVYASDLVDKPRQYKKYVALLTQSGRSAPVATVLENELSGDVVWTRNAIGSYNGTLVGEFADMNKFFGIVGNGTGITFKHTFKQISLERWDNNSVRIGTGNGDLSVPTSVDDVLSNTSIEIRVYN